MGKHLLPLLVAVATILAATAAASPANTVNSTTEPTAYEMLGRYGFPVGLLPEGAQSYKLQQDGSFEVHLANECRFRVGGYSIHYSSRVAGNIQNGAINGLEGVKGNFENFY
ncbi:uncharacterized protein LOC100836370 [Brachypodium distachyon]|uniref:uncharacterized protein LOC100836370 n=1 Tax=Brachypodium distachyon TaxID=15368 RepID=UPI00071C340A|nr:uncharacterized protein LOC100836370 [Brachypodium distachyon]|eukprot:XP_014757833.1 uncharacterized protein LOC100836370 [Brachypodium distachyon]